MRKGRGRGRGREGGGERMVRKRREREGERGWWERGVGYIKHCNHIPRNSVSREKLCWKQMKHFVVAVKNSF